MYLYDHYRDSLPASFTFTTRSQDEWTQPVALPFCGSGPRVNCIVDGDTIWLGSEKIRLEGLNAPEISGNCAAERELAQRAKRRLRELLSGQSLSISRNGYDAYGRTLATVRTSSGDAADIMVGQGLAHVWRGYKESWCG
jgi:endonuclease YncB( thermonuclease family)